MSNYIQVLKRLERDRRAPAAPPAEAERAEIAEALHEKPRTDSRPAVARVQEAAATGPAITPTIEPATSRAIDVRRFLATTSETEKGLNALLDNIRVLAPGRATRMVVFAGASSVESVGLITSGLARHAEGQGMRVLIAELTKANGHALVMPRIGAPAFRGERTREVDPGLEIDLNGRVSPADLNGWVERVAPGADLVVVTGPPLADSIDAALLACACDGLVIVAESEVTERVALHSAAERARIAGCRTLGVVMHGTKDRMPVWMRRLIGANAPSRTPRED